MMDWSPLEALVRLFGAIAAGGLLGLIAERHQRPAGLRTHILVSVGAFVFCAAGRELVDGNYDPLRALQGVAAGIGFVGAATVLKRGGNVIGVTTAASIWFASALGCEVALGEPLWAIAAGAIVTGLSELLRQVEQRWLRRDHRERKRRGGEDEEDRF